MSTNSALSWAVYGPHKHDVVKMLQELDEGVIGAVISHLAHPTYGSDGEIWYQNKATPYQTLTFDVSTEFRMFYNGIQIRRYAAGRLLETKKVNAGS
jgi:hypothetical protein